MDERGRVIVCGAGPAGLMVSHVLSSRGFHVILVEEGDLFKESKEVREYHRLGECLSRSIAVQRWWSVSQDALHGKNVFYPIGRGVGGAANVNYGISCRGTVQDYDWLQVSRERLDELFEGMEDVLRTQCAWVDEIGRPSRVLQDILASNAIRRSSMSRFDVYETYTEPRCYRRKDGARLDYARLVKEHHNVTLMTRSKVTRLCRQEGKITQVVVHCQHSRTEKVITHVQDVVLCCGTMGNAKLIKDIKERTDHDFANYSFIDHFNVPLLLWTWDITMLRSRLVHGYWHFQCPVQQQHGNQVDTAHFQVIFLSFRGIWPCVQDLLARHHILRLLIYLLLLPLRYVLSLFLGAALLVHVNPSSRGKVGYDAKGQLLVDPNFLHTEWDKKSVAQGIRHVQLRLATTRPRGFRKKITLIAPPPFLVHAYISWMGNSTFHPVGTCAMHQVVDEHFRVKNMQNLYAADASVIPISLSSNVQHAVMMLAYKFASELRT